ncbi:MAG: sulfate ABC transporter substrate-binding protein [Haliea sp.]|nr:sulfate ABC transporter substrate-binding protein [Haliea sp.]|tara:strand:+ start:41675 stop:43534 length:1860 start_codon:yes stop_codon:yes gene_type:complete
MMNDKTPVGEVRPSQLLWTYGPGSLIDLPNLSVVTLGTDRWEKDRCQPIQEARLLAAVRKELGVQVESLRMPPFQKSELVDPWSSEANIGVPVRPFPRWLRCVKCGLLSPFDAGLFEIKENRYRPERTRFVHKGCRGSKGDLPAKDADAVPARFLLACRDGHLDDFPWHYFVHGGNSTCKGTLRFFESGASLQTENLWVKCDECGASRSMAHAFGKAGQENLPACRGRHPHLDHFGDGCDEEPRAVLLGATNSWFPITLSALAIPQTKDPLGQLVQDGWEFFEDLESEAEVAVTVKTLKKTGALPGIDKYPASAIWAAIESHRAGGGDEIVTEADIKAPEWDVLTEKDPPTDYPHFMSKKVAAPSSFVDQIGRVLLLERLREVNALLGFTRVEAPEESGEPGERPQRASLTRGNPDWVPASEVHGEGIFIQFDEQAIEAWEDLDAVKEVDGMLRGGHKGWRNSRRLDPDEGYPGIRYAMLHTLSHLLIRELALECGYNAASIRERIYADTSGDSPQAGILIYTAAADSDGTLGGLVDLGRPENLGRLLEQALNRSKVCSSDPLCSEHDPRQDRSLHAAACHACSLVAETSCEKGNRYLDRSLLIPTLERAEAAFFKGVV